MDAETDITDIIDHMEDLTIEHEVNHMRETDYLIRQLITTVYHQVGTRQKHIDTHSEHDSKTCKYGFT